MAGKWRKRLKKLGKNLSKVVKVAAPIAAFAIGGPIGLAIGAGGALTGAALTPGNRQKKFKSLKRSAVAVAAAGAGSAALGLISGSGITAGGLTSLGKIGTDIFGGGTPTPPSGSSGLDGALLSDNRTNQNSPVLDFGGFLGTGSSGAGTSQTSDPNEQGMRGGGPFGGFFGGDEPAGEAGGIKPIWIVAGLGAVLLLSKKKAG